MKRQIKHGKGISIHSPLAGRDAAGGKEAADEIISIHSPLAGRDQLARGTRKRCRISIHSPLAGRDRAPSTCRGKTGTFQSTRPSRGETARIQRYIVVGRDFNPLAPRGARQSQESKGALLNDFNPLAPRGARQDSTPRHQLDAERISIHSPLAGRDWATTCLILLIHDFNPLAPRGARHNSRPEEPGQ